MSEEPDVGDYEEYVLSDIEDQASEEVAQKYQEIEREAYKDERVEARRAPKCKCDGVGHRVNCELKKYRERMDYLEGQGEIPSNEHHTFYDEEPKVREDGFDDDGETY